MADDVGSAGRDFLDAIEGLPLDSAERRALGWLSDWEDSMHALASLVRKARATQPSTTRVGDDAPPRMMYGMNEAAEQLGISARTLGSMATRRQIASVKIGGRRLFPRAGLEDYINQLLKDA